MLSLVLERIRSIGDAERSALRAYWSVYERDHAAISEETRRACEDIPAFVAVLRAISPEQLREQDARSLALQRAAIVDGAWEPYLADLATQGAQYAAGGIRFSDWFALVAAFRNIVRRRCVERAREDEGDEAARVADGLNIFVDTTMAALGEAYIAAKEQIISRQQEAIREISTPVLQIRDQVLVIPIVGVVDTHRARLLTTSLLRSVRERRARAVIMDVTGVPIVDSRVANHLAQACEAARLMGAVVIVTGISQEIAQTLVTIGADLKGVRTLGDLQGGMDEIDQLLGARPERGAASEPAGPEAP